MARLGLASMMAVLAAMLGGCGGGSSGGGEQSVSTDYEGPIASTDLARGEQVYNDVCMACHAGGAPTLDSIAWDAARMRQQIREGSGRMPPMRESRVSDDDMEAILAYMVTTGGVAGEGGAEPATSGGEEEPAGEEDAGGEEEPEAGDDSGV